MTDIDEEVVKADAFWLAFLAYLTVGTRKVSRHFSKQHHGGLVGYLERVGS